MTKPMSNDRGMRRGRSAGRGTGTAEVLAPLSFACGATAMFIAGLPGIGWGLAALGGIVSAAVVSRRNPRFSWGPLLMVAMVPLLSGVAVAPVAQADAAPGDFQGWTRDYVDDFNGPLDVTKWGRYESSTNSIGALSEYDAANVFTANGSMVLRTYNAGGTDWRAGGVSGARGYSAAQGKWTMRAKFDRACGIGYAFLLYPKGGSWPPEVDIAEGTAGGPRVMSTWHWSPANLTDSRFKFGIDMT